ncbi:unnamed protein product [Ambrosiozyma monospora]|uniref:Unnamed protein product n=1 Tax=Ambrosiozyma monospora TaxID=43982 RepID=A0ACB5TVP8_AMBMO|nr:unnamed protein product [Ambrosiozyma monospora]
MSDPVQLILFVFLSSLLVSSGFPLPIDNSSSELLPHQTLVNSKTTKPDFESLSSDDDTPPENTLFALVMTIPFFILFVIILSVCVSRSNKKKKAALEKENFSVNNKNVSTSTIDMSDPMMFPVSHPGKDQIDSSKNPTISGRDIDTLVPGHPSAPPPAHQHASPNDT